MPVSPTYPGVYIEEIPSGVRTITGVATSITGFVGRALRGPQLPADDVRRARFLPQRRQAGNRRSPAQSV
jgi:phage tail sheath protein FI